MKRLIWIASGVLIGALALPAQQGRGGSPLAWNDADKDGICDVTGQAVGQRPAARGVVAQPQGQRAFRGPGRGARARGAAWRGRGGRFAAQGTWRGRGLGVAQSPAEPQPETTQ